VPPSYEEVNFDADALHKEPLRLQLKVFMDEVQQQLMLPTIRSYLKLYTTMPLDKMAGFMDQPPEEFRNHLLAFKHKMKNVVWTKGTSGLEGEFQSGSEVDFYIDKNMIHIADTKVARRYVCPFPVLRNRNLNLTRRYGDFFIRQIHKFDELNRGLRKIQL
jgi:translation initiation factor 3 subunit L